MLIANGNYLRTAQTLDTGFTAFDPHRLNGDGLAAYTGWAGVRRQSAVPVGYGMRSFIPPITGGDLCGRVFDNALTATASGLMGVPITGTAAISITLADATGALVTFGEGEATIDVLAESATLTASIQGEGDATVELSASGTIGAKASIEGTSAFSLAPGTAVALPSDDDSPLRTGTASFSLTGSLTPYAKGHMTGAALPYTELSPASLADAVWTALADQYTGTGTMGEKVNAAGTAGDPWTGEISAGLSAQAAMQTILAVLAGKATGGGSGTITFRDLDDTRDAVVLTVDATGNRSAVEVN